jgi:hypothetical protein
MLEDRMLLATRLDNLLSNLPCLHTHAPMPIDLHKCHLAPQE